MDREMTCRVRAEGELKPLAGIRVVEFAQMIAAPSAGLLLRDYGAEVIKVEPPAGDGCRQLRSPASRVIGAAPIFTAYNRGKTLLTLDLTTDEGLGQALELIEGADILIEASRPGTMDRLGLGYEQLRMRFPALVYASVSGFGDGPIGRSRGGVDIIVQAESGMMALTGESKGTPTKIGFTVIDAACGHALCHGILAALVQRVRTGKGDLVRLSLYDVALHLQTGPLSEYLATGVQPERTGNSSPLAAPADMFRCGAGEVILSAYLEPHWNKLVALLGQPALASDPRFATAAARVANRDALRTAIEARLAAHDARTWTELLREQGLLAGEVKTYAEVLDDPIAAEAGIILQDGELCGVVNPVRIGAETEWLDA